MNRDKLIYMNMKQKECRRNGKQTATMRAILNASDEEIRLIAAAVTWQIDVQATGSKSGLVRMAANGINLLMASTHETITASEAARSLGLSRSTGRRGLLALLTDGCIRQVDNDDEREARYEEVPGETELFAGWMRATILDALTIAERRRPRKSGLIARRKESDWPRSEEGNTPLW